MISIQVKLISYPKETDLIAKMAAAVCYSGGHDYEEIRKDAESKPAKYLSKIVKNGHLSILEHNIYVFYISGLSRVASHQLVRKRIASYSQQSQRYVDAKNFRAVIPDTIEKSQFLEQYNKKLEDCSNLYQQMVDGGIPKEDARFILPGATTTQLMVSMNAHALIDFFVQRLCCYDTETEVLTKRGWKYFEELKEDDMFYTLNLEEKKCEFVKATKFFREWYEGEMVRVQSQSIDLLVTPNHKNVVSYSYENKKFKLDEAENSLIKKRVLMKKNCFPVEGKKAKYFRLMGPKYNVKNQFTQWERKHEDRYVKIKELFRFLGMYLADGYSYNCGYHYYVGISEGNEKRADFYGRILASLSKNKVRKIRDRTSWKVEVHDRTLYEFFKPLGKAKTKRIPNFVWKYDHILLNEIFKGLCDGDMTKRETGQSYSTISVKLAGDMQRLLLHIGYSGTMSMVDRVGRESQVVLENGQSLTITHRNPEYRVSINKTKNEPIIKTTNRDAFTKEGYKNYVHCVELESNNTLYVRRNGRTVWSGNSRSQWEIRQLAVAMLEEAQNVSPLIFKDLGAYCDFYGYCPENDKSCGRIKTLKELLK